jgi:predicted Zn-dependent protease
MKQFILTLVIAVVAMAIAACGGAAGNANSNKPAANTNKPEANTNTQKAAAPVDGDTIKIDEAGIQMTVPKGFKFSKDGEDTLVSTEDEGVAVRFHIPKDGDYDKARLDAAKNIDEYIDNVKIEEKDVKKTINGMEAYSSSGTGLDSDKKEVNWELTILKTDKKPVLAIIYAEKPSMEKHAAALKTFFDSIKKQ